MIVQREETQAAQKAKETQAIADDAQRDLNEALPALVIFISLCHQYQSSVTLGTNLQKNLKIIL